MPTFKFRIFQRTETDTVSQDVSVKAVNFTQAMEKVIAKNGSNVHIEQLM